MEDDDRPLPRSLVVLPTYNERENVEGIVSRVLDQGADFDVLIVDDGSPDGTGEIADRLAATTQGRVHALHRTGKQGLGTAYLLGFQWALERSYDTIFEMDADFSHDPDSLPKLRAPVRAGIADVAVGSRWVAGGATRNWSLLRTVISRGGSLYARLLLGVPVRDLTSGFKCFGRHVLERVRLDQVQSNGYAFQVEMNYRCIQAGYRIQEVPITFVDRRVGQSKMGMHIVLEAMAVVLGLRLRGWTEARRPSANGRLARMGSDEQGIRPRI